jgi:hypothetical protein
VPLLIVIIIINFNTTPFLDINFPLPLRRLALLRLALSLTPLPLIIIILHIPTPLQPLHLPRLQPAQINLAQVDAANLVAHGVGRNVLLGALLVGAARLLHGLLLQRVVGAEDAAQPEVHARAVLLELHAGQLVAGAAGADGVDAQAEDGFACWVGGVGGDSGGGGGGGRSGGGFVGRDGDDVAQAFDVDLVGGFAAEEVDEEGLGEGEFVGDGRFEGGAGKDHQRTHADGDLFAVFELRDGPVRVAVQAELEHVKDLVVKGAHKGDGVRALLVGAAEEEEGAVVLFGEEGEGGGVFEGVDWERDSGLVSWKIYGMYVGAWYGTYWHSFSGSAWKGSGGGSRGRPWHLGSG